MRKIFYKLFVVRLILILVFSSLPRSIALSADPVVIPGFDPEAVNLGAVRYRALKTDGTMGPAEVFLGVPDLGDGANRETQNLTWAAQNDVVL